MNKLLLSAVLLFSSSAFASLIGNVDHAYGTDNYVPSFLGSTACDTKHANSLTVKDSGPINCQRFVDVFDFSAFDFASVDYFELELTFSATNNDNCWWIFCDYENWYVRPAKSTSFAATSSEERSLIRADGKTIQTFMFNATNLSSIFSDIVDNKKFYLWFAEESFGSDQFNLFNAKLSVYGSPVIIDVGNNIDPAKVPAPASLALLGLGLLMLGRFKK